jgi:hypothetical protein
MRSRTAGTPFLQPARLAKPAKYAKTFLKKMLNTDFFLFTVLGVLGAFVLAHLASI